MQRAVCRLEYAISMRGYTSGERTLPNESMSSRQKPDYGVFDKFSRLQIRVRFVPESTSKFNNDFIVDDHEASCLRRLAH